MQLKFDHVKPPAKFNITNKQFLVFDTQCLDFDTNFLVFNTTFLVFNTKIIIFAPIFCTPARLCRVVRLQFPYSSAICVEFASIPGFIIKSAFFNRKSGFLNRKSGFFH